MTGCWPARVSRYGSMLVGEMYGHHNVEDVHYFPRLRQLDSRLEKGFDMLDSDHLVLAALLETFSVSVNNALDSVSNGADWRAPTDVFRNGLHGVKRDLSWHLVDEEDLIVPVLLRYAPTDLM